MASRQLPSHVRLLAIRYAVPCWRWARRIEISTRLNSPSEFAERIGRNLCTHLRAMRAAWGRWLFALLLDIHSAASAIHPVRVDGAYRDMLPTPAKPFVFYHLAKAAGSSLREAVFKAARMWHLEATVPCHTLSCNCQEGFMFHNFDKFCKDKQTSKPIDLSKSAVIAGHFSPRAVLSRRSLNQSAYTCYTMLRDPVSRAISHFTFFHFGMKKSGNATVERPFSDLSLEEVEAFVKSVDDRYQADTLGCPHDDVDKCAKEDATKILDGAKRIVDTCVVGVFEKYEGSLAFLTLVYPWIGNYSDLVSIHDKPTKHITSAQLPAATAALMGRHYDVEFKLHNYTESKLRSQMLAATRCMSRNKVAVAGRATAPTERLMVDLAVAVERKGHAARSEFATCVASEMANTSMHARRTRTPQKRKKPARTT